MESDVRCNYCFVPITREEMKRDIATQIVTLVVINGTLCHKSCATAHASVQKQVDSLFDSRNG